MTSWSKRGPARRVVRIACALAALAASGLLPGCALLPKEEIEPMPTLAEPPPTRTVTYTVERGHIAEEIRGLGRVTGTREVELYFTVGGRVKTLEVQTGDTVKAGQLLAQLETGDLEYQIAVAEIDLEELNLRLERARQLARINGVADDPTVRDLELGGIDQDQH
ncbi:MAG TPA: biotin/lipoyl-binding protein, partial [Limnochordia bacterium]